MRKILSIFMSAVLAITMVPAIALADTPSPNAATGEFMLTMHRREALAETNFTILLKSPSTVGSRTLTLKAAKDQETSEVFAAGIADGTYEMTITAPKYLTYRQTVKFDGRCVHFDLYNYQSANDGIQSSSKLGVMPMGDMNTDGVINDADADLVKNAVSSNNKAYDVSGNGTVDLNDVAFVVRNAGSCVAATPMHTISSTLLKQQATVAATNGTNISGNAADVLSQSATGGSISLSTGSKISSGKPAVLSIDTPNTTQSTEALVIAPPANNTANTISKGSVEIVGTDEKGNTINITAPVDSTAVASKSASTMQVQTALASYSPEEAEAEENEAEAQAEAVPTEETEEAVEPVQNPAEEAPQATPENAPEEATENVQPQEGDNAGAFNIITEEAEQYGVAAQPGEITVENDGTVVIDLGTRVAIKKVTIRVTETANQGNLAEIAKVEFLSDFQERIPEPQLSIPTINSVSNTNSDGQGYKSITINWTPQVNVTGYEVSISGNGYNKTAMTSKASHTFQGDSFNGTVKSFLSYDIKVRSVSGDWRSPWSDVFKHEVTCTNKPPAPQYVSVSSLVERLKVSWNCKFDAEWYSLFYKEKTSTGSYAEIKNIKTTNYSLSGLQAGKYYQVYVVAHNRNGASPNSALAEGKTLISNLTRMPKFDILNENDSEGMATTSIKSVTGDRNKTYEIRTATGKVNQSQATYENWKAILDNNADSYLYIPDWDSGVAYANFRGPIIQLQDRVDIDTFRFSPSDKVSSPSLYAAQIRYKDYDKNGAYTTVNTGIYTKYDSDNHKYYEIITPQPINSDYFELRLRTLNTAPITIQELKLYKYNSLDHDIENLFADDMRTMLKEGVTAAQVQALIDRSNTVDIASGELHPHHASQMAELNYAMEIVKNGAHNIEYVSVDNQITSRGEPASGFAQALSDYQPLGYVGAEGETLVIYVTDENGKTSRGAVANLNLICTQMHPEVTAWQKSVSLKAGRNEIVIPRVSSLAKERGGSLYLQYTGDKGFNKYKVRVLGGTKIPVLNVTGKTGADRSNAIRQYTIDLKNYVATIEAQHSANHLKSENVNVDYAYNSKECINNYTDICMDYMMYSFPATQVNSALGASSTDSVRAAKLDSSIQGMEKAIEYFYQFKGLNKSATDNDRYPNLRLNVRYHKMFTGAFMYAAGKHIGIEWGSVGGQFGLTPLQADSKGQKTSGTMPGWGIAHEIGHCINAGAYQRVEVTNNVYAQIGKSANSGEVSSAFRANYERVYAGVAAGNVHHNGDLKVQLAQYWQLHLAYDNNYGYKVYDTHAAQKTGLFYARMESYLRNRSTLPVAFIGNPSGDQVLMQAACAAANKDVLDYFRAWGYTPNASTVQYASNFAKETRKIQYIDDDARLYRIQGKSRMSTGTKVVASVTNATDQRINGNTVKISLGTSGNTVSDALLGYEIKRNGKVVAFVQASKTTYNDVLSTENNKAFTYEVTAYDKYLNATATLALDEVKVCHDGSIDRTGWTATSTTAKSKQDTLASTSGDADDPDGGVVEGTTIPGTNTISAAKNVIDGNVGTIFCAEGGGTTATRPNIVIDLGKSQQVTALKYTPATVNYNKSASDNFEDSQMNSLRPFGYKIELSQDGTNWTTVKEGELYKSGYTMANKKSWVANTDIIVNNDAKADEEKSLTIFFSKKDNKGNLLPYMNTYDASFVRFTATNMSTFATSEINILGPTSDNVELIQSGYGTLKSDFKYGPAAADFIPKDSCVLYGSYKGDPSYNIVLLKDQNGNVIDGQFIIMADVVNGALGETSNGRWIFWMEGKQKTDANGKKYNELTQFAKVTKVKAELYRVDNAVTLAGQRITSTSLTMNVPSTRPQITLTTSSGATLQGSNTANAMYTMREDQAIDNDGNVIFDAELAEAAANTEPATEEEQASENGVQTVQLATSAVDGKYAAAPEDEGSSDSQPRITNIEAAENADADAVVNMFAAGAADSLDVAQAELKSLGTGFTFKVNPSSIAIASEGVFTFDPKLPANLNISVKGLANAKSANATYNGSFFDSKGRLHVFVVARSGILGNCATSQTNLSFSGTISGLDHRVKGIADYISDIDGDYGTPTVTIVGGKGVDFFAYGTKQITSAQASPASYTYNKKVIVPTVIATYGNTVLNPGADYTVTTATGCKKVGTYTALVNGIGAFTGTKTVSFKIVPKGTTIKSLKAGKRSMIVKIKKQSTETTGYKIRYSLKKTMKSAKTVTVNKAKTTKKTIKKLKSKKTYYVQIATYKKIGKNTYQSDWSKAKKVKIK